MSYKNTILVLGISFLLASSAIIGNKRDNTLRENRLSQILTEQFDTFTQIYPNKWSTNDTASGNIYFGVGDGYNPGIQVLFQLDSLGGIQMLRVISHNETPSYYKLTKNKNFLKKLVNRYINDIINKDKIDIISGATLTQNGIIEAIKQGYYAGESIETTTNKKFNLGWLELIVTVLFVLGIVAPKVRNQKIRTLLNWLTPAIALIGLGFIYNRPLSTSRFVSLITGYFPDIYSELYLYILLILSIGLILFTGTTTHLYQTNLASSINA